MTDYRFEIHFQPKEFKFAVDFMKKWDIEMEYIYLVDKMEFSCSQESPIEKIKDMIHQTYVSDGHIVVSIKGGIFE